MPCRITKQIQPKQANVKIFFTFLSLLCFLLLAVACGNFLKNKEQEQQPIHRGDTSLYQEIMPLIDQADVIVEGKQDSFYSFIGTRDGIKGIYTCGVITLYKVFKGDIKGRKIEICAEGGYVEGYGGSFCTHCDDYGHGIINGEVSILFAHAADFDNPISKIGKRYRFDLQYGISYDGIVHNTSYERTRGYLFDPKDAIYPALKERTGHGYRETKKFDYADERQKKEKKKILNRQGEIPIPTITSISPQTLTAGTQSLLTINGANFDTSMRVQFLNANNGGLPTGSTLSYVTVPKNHIKSWTSSKIEVYVPSIKQQGQGVTDIIAGTGKVYLEYNSSPSMTVESSDTLHIPYATTNIAYSSNRKIAEIRPKAPNKMAKKNRQL